MALDVKFRAMQDDKTAASAVVGDILQAYDEFMKCTSDDKSLIMLVSTNASQMQKFPIIKGSDPQAWLGQIPRTKVDSINAMLDTLKGKIKADNNARMRAQEDAEKARKQDAMSLKTFKASENPDIVEMVIQNNPIIEVASRYTDVIKNNDGESVAKSPLYKNGAYTLIFDEDKNRFFDFALGKNGNVIDFVTMAERQKTFSEVSVDDVIKSLVSASPEKYSDEVRDRVFVLENKVDEINAMTKEFYKQGLTADGGKAVDYFKSRGFSKKTMEVFELGYAEGSWNGLRSYMHKKEIGDEQLVAAGVVTKSENNGRYFDFYHDRAIVPIHDSEGKCVGFGGRTLVDDKAKYLNTRETPTFHKGDVLFNYNIAKNSSQPSIIVVEGFMDAISAYQSKLDNVVAGMGTALTEHQADLLKATGKEVILAYDNDDSGRRACESSKAILESKGIKVSVFDTSRLEVKDFNDVLVSKGIQGISQALEHQNMNVVTFGYPLEVTSAEMEKNAKTALGKLKVPYISVQKGEKIGFLFDTRKATEVRREINVLSGNIKHDKGQSL